MPRCENERQLAVEREAQPLAAPLDRAHRRAAHRLGEGARAAGAGDDEQARRQLDARERPASQPLLQISPRDLDLGQLRQRRPRAAPRPRRRAAAGSDSRAPADRASPRARAACAASGTRRSGCRATSSAGMPSSSASMRSMPCSSRLKNGRARIDSSRRARTAVGAQQRHAAPSCRSPACAAPASTATGSSTSVDCPRANGERPGRYGSRRREERARIAEHRARAPPDERHHRHHAGLGHVVRPRREDRRVVAIAARHEHVEHALATGRSRARESRPAAVARSRAITSCALHNLVVDALARRAAPARTDGCGCGCRARGRRAPAAPSCCAPGDVAGRVAADDEEGGVDARAARTARRSAAARGARPRARARRGGAPRPWMP